MTEPTAGPSGQSQPHPDPYPAGPYPEPADAGRPADPVHPTGAGHPAPVGYGPAPLIGPTASHPPRRALRTALRWGAALLLFAATGAGTGYAVTQAERGDLPGLATDGDGRWDYPELALPALPAGSPRPFDEANTGQLHHADLRDLLLPAPRGAEPDPDLPAAAGWLPDEAFAATYAEGEREELTQALVDNAVRHIAATGWTMPDGTRARIYLLQFNSGALAAHFYDEELAGGISPARELTGAAEAEVDESWSEEDQLADAELYVYDEPAPRGKEHVRQAYVVAGDTVGLVVVAAPGETARIPFQQTLVLQHQLLG